MVSGKNTQYCLFLPVGTKKLQNWGNFGKGLSPVLSNWHTLLIHASGYADRRHNGTKSQGISKSRCDFIRNLDPLWDLFKQNSICLTSQNTS